MTDITQSELDAIILREYRVRAMADRIASANGNGALHIVIGDGNLDGYDIEFCMAESQHQITPSEIDLCNDLLAMPLSERHMAYEIVNGPQYD